MKIKRIIWWILFGLLVTGSIFGLFRYQTRVAVLRAFPAHGEVVSAFSVIEFEFNQPMDTASVEHGFTLSPPVEGSFEWNANTLFFIPFDPLTENREYIVRFTSGVTSASGRKLPPDLHIEFGIRSAEVMYLSPAGDKAKLYRYVPQNGQTYAYDNLDEGILDFAVAQNGEQIVYSLPNTMGGVDLWLTDRYGETTSRLVDCGNDVCLEPAFAPRLPVIAFFRQNSQGYGRIWTVRLDNGSIVPLFEDEAISGEQPNWSWDGNYISFYDVTNQGVRVLEIATAKSSFIPTAEISSGSWVPHSKRLVFSDVRQDEEGIYSTLQEVNLLTQSMQPFQISPLVGVYYSEPRFSADGKWAVLGIHPLERYVNQQLWLIDMKSGNSRPISDDVLSAHGEVWWDPQGERILIQKLQLGSSSNQPEIWLWDRNTDQLTNLAMNAAHPRWLP